MGKDSLTGFIVRLTVKGQIPLELNVKQPDQTERFIHDNGWMIEQNSGEIAVDGFRLLNTSGLPDTHITNNNFQYKTVNYDYANIPEWYGHKQFKWYDGYTPTKSGESGYKLLNGFDADTTGVSDNAMDLVMLGTAVESTSHTAIDSVLHGWQYTGYGTPEVTHIPWPLDDPIWAALNDPVGVDPIPDCQTAANAQAVTGNSSWEGHYGLAPTSIVQGGKPCTRYICSDYRLNGDVIEVLSILANDVHNMTAVCLSGTRTYRFIDDVYLQNKSASWTNTIGPGDPVFNHLNLADGKTYIIDGDMTFTDTFDATYTITPEWSVTTVLPVGDYEITVYNLDYYGAGMIGTDFDVDILLFGSKYFKTFTYSDTLADDVEKAPKTCTITLGKEIDYVKGMTNPFIKIT
jgi:hypothetical protein